MALVNKGFYSVSGLEAVCICLNLGIGTDLIDGALQRPFQHQAPKSHFSKTQLTVLPQRWLYWHNGQNRPERRKG